MIDADKILHDEMTAAMKARSEQPYSNEDGFQMKVKAINPLTGSAFPLPITWTSEEDKRQKMLKACVTAHFAKIPALIVVSDARWLQAEKFSEHFKIAKPNPDNINEWQKQYHQILHRYGDSMVNLPRELWSETLLVCIKGPEVKMRMITSCYVEGLHDRVQWTQTYNEAYEGLQNNMVSDYWTDDFMTGVNIPPKMKAILEKTRDAFGRHDD